MNGRTKEFFAYVVPSVLAFALSGVYTIVDGFFVGQSLGDIGLAAITLGSGLCFRRLEPPLESSHALIRKRHAVLSKPAEAFLEKVKQA